MRTLLLLLLLIPTVLFAVGDYTLLYGVVVDREGNIVGDAKVELIRKKGDIEKTVGVAFSRGRLSIFYDGMFFFKDIPPGAYILRVSKDGYADFEVGVGLREGEIVFRRIVLRELSLVAGSVYGRVLAKKSIPIKGLTVELRKEGAEKPLMSTKTDEKGGYSFKDVQTPAEYELVVIHKRKELVREKISLRKKQRLRKVVELPDEALKLFFGSVEGYVKDENGKPIKGARVTMKEAPEGQKKKSVSTDSSGRFELTLLIPGTYKLEVTASGKETEEERISVRAGRKRRVNFRLRKKKR